jgi:hypothetical protein
VTQTAAQALCAYCRRPFPVSPGSGRPARYCRRSHRQRAYEARRRARNLQLPDSQLIVDQASIDRLHDKLYRLESALQDVDADLDGDHSPAAYRLAFHHLYETANELRGVVVEPVTG